MKTTSFFVNILMKLHKVAVKTLAIPTMKRNMPILTFILSQFFNVLKCSHPLKRLSNKVHSEIKYKMCNFVLPGCFRYPVNSLAM